MKDWLIDWLMKDWLMKDGLIDWLIDEGLIGTHPSSGHWPAVVARAPLRPYVAPRSKPAAASGWHSGAAASAGAADRHKVPSRPRSAPDNGQDGAAAASDEGQPPAAAAVPPPSAASSGPTSTACSDRNGPYSACKSTPAAADSTASAGWDRREYGAPAGRSAAAASAEWRVGRERPAGGTGRRRGPRRWTRAGRSTADWPTDPAGTGRKSRSARALVADVMDWRWVAGDAAAAAAPLQCLPAFWRRRAWGGRRAPLGEPPFSAAFGGGRGRLHGPRPARRIGAARMRWVGEVVLAACRAVGVGDASPLERRSMECCRRAVVSAGPWSRLVIRRDGTTTWRRTCPWSDCDRQSWNLRCWWKNWWVSAGIGYKIRQKLVEIHTEKHDSS